MNVFHHLIYEYQKGLRDLCLHTCEENLAERIKKRLESLEIKYEIQKVGTQKINVFFGLKECVEIVKAFSSKNLNMLSDEEDFILGIMLGYGKHQQYQRLLKRRSICA